MPTRYLRQRRDVHPRETAAKDPALGQTCRRHGDHQSNASSNAAYTQNKRSHSHRNVTMSALVCARLSCVPTGCIHFFSHEPNQLRPFRVCKSGAAGPDSAALAAHKLVWKDCSSNGGKIYVKIGKEGTNPGPAREGKAAGRAWSRSVLWCRIRLRQIRLRRSGCDGGGSGCGRSGMLSGCSTACDASATRQFDCNGSNCK